MPSRRCAALVLALVATAALTGCSGDEPAPAPPAPTAAATPTAVGDPPLVEVVDPGAGQARALALDLIPASPSAATLVISQQIARDETATQVPPITLPFEVAVAGTEGDETTTTQTYDRPTIDATGLRPVDVRTLRSAVAPVTGTTSTLVVGPDGAVVEARSGVAAARPFDAQIRALVPVLPGTQVGVGATWTATSVARVDGAPVDQVATYTLEALDGDDYVISVSIDQTYRPGPVEDVEVRSGRGTLTARLEGSLTRLLPDDATGSASTQVSYLVGDRVTEIRTTITLGLTSG